MNWYGKFKGPSRALRASLGDGPEADGSDRGGLYRLAALTSEPTPRLIVEYNQVRPGRTRADTDLWIADLDGGRPALLADERGRASFQFEPAPGSARVAYISGVAGRADDPQPLRQTTLRLARPGSPPRTIASGGVQAPGWSADGKILYFLKAVDGGWEPRMSVDAGLPVAISDVIFTQPGDWREPPARFSPDGRLVAGVRGDRLVVVEPQTKRVREYRQISGSLTKISWSPDSEWLHIQAIQGRRMARFLDQALRLADGKVVALDNRLDLLAQPAQGDAIDVVAAGWAPGLGHRLLLFAQTRQGPGDIVFSRPGVPDIREARWLVRDLDRDTSTEVLGLPARYSPVDPSRLDFTPDGRHVLGPEGLSLLDGPL